MKMTTGLEMYLSLKPQVSFFFRFFIFILFYSTDNFFLQLDYIYVN